MKRYIKSTEYTPLDFDNKMDVMKWMDIAEARIRQFCKTLSTKDYYYEVDDVSWGSSSFQIPVFKGSKSDPKDYHQAYVFKFYYDEDDGSAIKQLNHALDEWIDDIEYYRNEANYL